MRRKFICFILVGVLAGAMLTGCANENGLSDQSSQSVSGDATSESEVTENVSEESSSAESESVEVTEETKEEFTESNTSESKKEESTKQEPVEEVVESDVVASGVLEDADIEWEIIGTTLYVRGEGEIPDFVAKSTEAQDWQVYRDIIQKVIIEDGITKVGKGNFYYFLNLKEAILADSVEEIGEEGFYYTGLESIDLNNVAKLGVRAFANNHSLISVTIPGNITNIPLQCFGGSKNLNEVYIEEGVKKLQATSFFDMGKNLVIHLPSSVTYIHDEAWSNDLTVCVKAGSYAESYANEVAHRDNLTVVVE